MESLEGTAKTIFDEVMDEIDEEIKEALEDYIVEEKLKEIITSIQEETAGRIKELVLEHYKKGMSAVQKLILGEKVSRVVTAETKKHLRNLSNTILSRSFDLVDELRNEIIGEVFEETEDE